jgi:hypothetical protein
VTKKKWTLSFATVESSIVQNQSFLYTIVSYSVVFAVFLNLHSLQSSLLGLIPTVIYFLINALFLGNAFFEKEDAFFRLMFGILLLVMLLGFVGWLTLIIYNLDATRVTLVLVIVATLSSLLNRRMKQRNGTK